MCIRDRHYADLDTRKLELIDSLPFPAGVDDCDGVQQLISSARLVLADISARCDDSASDTLNSPRWVPGWNTPFHRCFRKAIKSVNSSPIARLIKDFFAQMRTHLEKSMTPALQPSASFCVS